VDDKTDKEFWERAGLWKGLSNAEKNEVRHDFSWHRVRHSAGQTVAFMGDPLENLMLVAGGILEAKILDMHGKVLKLETLKTGSVIAGPVLFSGDARLPVQLTAESDVVIVMLSKQETLCVLAGYPVVLENFLQEAGDKILFLAEKIRLLRFASIREKLAGHFLEVSRLQGGDEIRLRYSMEELADLFGVTRPALSRCLGGMVEHGLVERLGTGFYRLHRSGLQDLLE
jgi:CRP/FNR family transcriptional regulator, dissimilatory nitrate respiration regulator